MNNDNNNNNNRHIINYRVLITTLTKANPVTIRITTTPRIVHITLVKTIQLTIMIINMKTRKITREITLYVHHTPLTLVRRATHERTILYDENKKSSCDPNSREIRGDGQRGGRGVPSHSHYIRGVLKAA